MSKFFSSLTDKWGPLVGRLPPPSLPFLSLPPASSLSPPTRRACSLTPVLYTLRRRLLLYVPPLPTCSPDGGTATKRGDEADGAEDDEACGSLPW